MSNTPIDFVISWVDGNDPQWLEERAKYLGSASKSADTRKRRVRDWNNLHYLFRGIELYAQWVNHIYLVTPNQTPSWLNTKHPKITVVDQNALFPQELRPTFNNCAIELLLHKIPGLSENFVYLNDDMFIIKETTEEDFFKNGRPMDTVAFAPTQAIYSADGKGVYGIAVVCTRLVAKCFDKATVLSNSNGKFRNLNNGREIIKSICMKPFNAITGFNEMHTAYSLQKKTYEEVWAAAEDDLMASCKMRFRGEFNLCHWAMRYWQICSGNYEVRKRSFSKFFDIHKKGEETSIVRWIQSQKSKMVCINDNIDNDDEFDAIVGNVNAAFSRLFPEKSSYEL